MADTDTNVDGSTDRRTAMRMREVVDLVILELRQLGLPEKDIETFLARSRQHWQTHRI